MKNLKQELAWMIAAGTIVVGYSQNVFAQADPMPTSEPVETCDPDTPCAPPPAPPPAPAPEPQVYVPPPAEPTHTYVAEEKKPWLETVGLGFSIGGGVDDFASDTMRSETGLGGSWNVRATLGIRTNLAFEGSYIGSAQTIDAFGLDNDAILYGNGLQGALRLNFTTHYVAQPFVYGGVAWRHYDVSNADFNQSDIAGSDDVAEFPVGVGLSGYIGGFMADLRGEYRFATAEDLAPSNNNAGDATMDRWGVSGNLGFAY